MMVVRTLFVVMLLSGCGFSQTKVINFDLGGPLTTRAAQVDKWAEVGHTVEIRGVCYSACTMYLYMDNTCVSEDAVLGFHAPHNLFTKQVDREGVAIYRKYVRDTMLRDYDAHWSKTVEFSIFTGKELHEKYGINLCSEEG